MDKEKNADKNAEEITAGTFDFKGAIYVYSFISRRAHKHTHSGRSTRAYQLIKINTVTLEKLPHTLVNRKVKGIFIFLEFFL